MSVATQILSLAKQLLPPGRAFWVPVQQPGTGYIYTDESGHYLTDESGDYIVSEDYTPGGGGFFELLLKAFSGDGANRTGTMERCYNDAASIQGHIIPLANNSIFTDGTVNPLDNDCNDYESLLGLVQWGVTSSLTPTRAQRMLAIATKMRYPGTVSPRQSAAYIQATLQSAGFDVYVYENLLNKTPAEILGVPSGRAFYGSFDYGEVDYGETYGTEGISVIANHVNAIDDAGFSPGANNYGTFFISGSPITTFASIPAIQQVQFRQLVLSLKPAHMAAFCFINFT